MSELRGGLIGCGFFAINHLHAWRGVDGAWIVALCDRDERRLAVVGEQFGIAPRYRDAEALLADEQLDFVDIATTVSSHRPLVEMAATQGLAVICQNPFAASMAVKTLALVEAAYRSAKTREAIDLGSRSGT